MTIGNKIPLPVATVSPCNDCPWRRRSVAGWLGPYTAEEWVELVHSDDPIACHRTIQGDGSWQGALQCRGAASYRANLAKLPRDHAVVVGPHDDAVFNSPSEFLAHHQRSAGAMEAAS